MAKLRFAIVFAFVATHNHFVLDRGGRVFKQTAPVIKLPESATLEDHLDLLGLLNSSTLGFWMKLAGRERAAVLTRKDVTPSSVSGCPPRGGSGAKDEAIARSFLVSPSKALKANRR